jgi:hypothetical protein
MSTYLERLKAKTGEKHLPQSPSKPSKDTQPPLQPHLLNVLKVTSVDVSDAFSALSDDFEERAAICEFDGGLTRDEAEQMAALHAAPLPLGITEEQRAVVIDAAARFLDRRRKEAEVGRNL